MGVRSGAIRRLRGRRGDHLAEREGIGGSGGAQAVAVGTQAVAGGQQILGTSIGGHDATSAIQEQDGGGKPVERLDELVAPRLGQSELLRERHRTREVRHEPPHQLEFVAPERR